MTGHAVPKPGTNPSRGRLLLLARPPLRCQLPLSLVGLWCTMLPFLRRLHLAIAAVRALAVAPAAVSAAVNAAAWCAAVRVARAVAAAPRPLPHRARARLCRAFTIISCRSTLVF